MNYSMNDTSKSAPENSMPSHTELASAEATAPVKNSANSNKAAKKLRSRTISPSAWMTIALVGLAVLLVGQWWSATNQISQLREELARRLQAADASNAETKVIAKSVLETDKELQVKIGVLENKQSESDSHALALQQLYQDLSKNRDDWALSEIEQVLSTASQQLQLAGNVQGALIALQNADARLARSDKPQFLAIRRSIAHDIDRIKALPTVDLAGIALRLDSAIEQVDSMPLLIDESLASPTTRQPVGAPTKLNPMKKTSGKTATANKQANEPLNEESTVASWKRWLGEHWQRWTTEMWGELRQLVQVRNVENPDALLLTPSQGYFVKENVKLRLLNARLALLSRNETAFKSDLIAAQKEIAHYFDTRSKQTQAVQSLLRQIQNSKVSIEMPSLAESLNAVRNFAIKQ